jgi:hypothetical protein
MAISPADWSNQLLTAFQGKGFEGPDLPKLCDAIGNGSAQTVIGKPFATADTGTTPGVGVGSGTGITIVKDIVLAGILSNGASLSGPKFPVIADVVATLQYTSGCLSGGRRHNARVYSHCRSRVGFRYSSRST